MTAQYHYKMKDNYRFHRSYTNTSIWIILENHNKVLQSLKVKHSPKQSLLKWFTEIVPLLTMK